MFAKKARENPDYPTRCDEELKKGTLSRDDAILCNEVQAWNARIATNFQLCIDACKSADIIKFMRYVQQDIRVLVKEYELVPVLCQFTKVLTSTALQIRVNGADFYCDKLYFACNLSRIVEYLHFIQRAIDYPFGNVNEAIQVFDACETVVLELTKARV